MRIALIRPPYSMEEGFVAFPMEFVPVCGFLKARSNPVIIDLDLLLKTDRLKLNNDLFSNAAEIVLESKAEVFIFHVSYYTTPATLLIAQKCKRFSPKAIVILCGIEASFTAKEIIANFPFIDIVVKGEFENTLKELVPNIKRREALGNIKGIIYRRRDGKVIENEPRPLMENLDDLPLPDFSLLSLYDEYPEVKVLVGRGCPYNCVFCSDKNLWQRRVRYKSLERLEKELSLIDPSRFVCLYHHNLAVNRKKALSILSIVKKKKMDWRCLARLNHLDTDLLKIMAKSGCREIGVGMETGSEAMQKYIRKNLDLSEILEKVYAGIEQGIQMNLSFIMGFPEEKERDLNETLKLALKCRLLGASVQLRPLALERGNDLYSEAEPPLINDEILTHFNRLDAEKELIMKYPHLFPQFGIVRNKYMPAEFLIKTQILFMFLVEFYPALTFTLLKKMRISPLKLSKNLIRSFEKQGLKRWMFTWKAEKILEYYLPYFRNFLSSTRIAKIC
ncbi:MAG: radical SAM protein [Candidatus Margulisiibacteriota bacterium]